MITDFESPGSRCVDTDASMICLDDGETKIQNKPNA